MPRSAPRAWHQERGERIIGGKERPVGVLEVDSRRCRRFTQDDVNFLQGFANLLAAAIDRLHVHRRLGEVAARRKCCCTSYSTG